MKNVLYFTVKALFVPRYIKFLSCIFGHVEERFDWKEKVNFKTCDVTVWASNNCNTDITQYIKK